MKDSVGGGLEVPGSGRDYGDLGGSVDGCGLGGGRGERGGRKQSLGVKLGGYAEWISRH